MCPTVSSVSGWLCSTPNTLWPCPGGSSNVLQPDSGRCPPMASSGGRQPVAQRGSEGLRLLILRDVTCVRDLHVTRGRNRRRDRPVPYRARDEVVLSGDHNGRAFNGREGWQDVDLVEVVGVAKPRVVDGQIHPHLGPDPSEVGRGQGRAWIGEVHRPGRIEAGGPGLLVDLLIPCLVFLGKSANRGLVPWLGRMPGIGPLPLSADFFVVHGGARAINAAGVAVDYDQPLH